MGSSTSRRIEDDNRTNNSGANRASLDMKKSRKGKRIVMRNKADGATLEKKANS